MTTKLILIRHGQSEANQEDVVQSSGPGTDLTDLGRKQSEAVAKVFENTKIDAIYSSPTKRTIQTAEIINKTHNLEIKIKESLGERKFGILIGTPRDPKEQTSEQRKLHKKRIEFENYRVPDGESFIDVKKRTMKVINKILEEKNKTTIIIAHGNVIRAIISSMLHIPLLKTYETPSRNTCYTEIEIDEEPKLVKYFCAEHLEDI